MRARGGMVLLEAMIALAMLAIGAVSLITLADESLRAVRRADAADVATERASAFLDAVALWPRADLDRHLGDRAEGAWRLRVERLFPTLYTVTLADTLNGDVVLATSLYRPEDSHAVP